MNIINFEKLDSTNTYAKNNIETLEDKSIISADFQSAGYGRFKRKWVDLGAENIYMTFVLKPSDILKSEHANLTQYLSVCLCQIIELYFAQEISDNKSLSPKIKWPNDVLINGKKICGILAESVIKKNILKGIVIGIGVNLNAAEKHLNEIDRPANSLNLIFNRNIDKKQFMNKLIEHFFTDYETFLGKGFSNIKQNYENYSLLNINDEIKIDAYNKIKKGKFKGFTKEGNLILATENRNEILTTGELAS